MTPKQWEEEFARKFLFVPRRKKLESTDTIHVSGHEMKLFIRSLLKAERDAIEDEIQRVREEVVTDENYDIDLAFVDVLTFIRSRKEKV